MTTPKILLKTGFQREGHEDENPQKNIRILNESKTVNFWNGKR